MLFQANQYPPPLVSRLNGWKMCKAYMACSQYWIIELGSGEFLSSQDDPLYQLQKCSGAQKKLILDRQIHSAGAQDEKPETRQELSLAARRELLHQVCLQTPPELRDQIVVLAAQALPPSAKPCWTGMLELSTNAKTAAFGPVVETLQARSCLSLPIARVDPLAESTATKSLSWSNIDSWEWRTSSLLSRLTLCKSIELLCATVLPIPSQQGHWTSSRRCRGPARSTSASCSTSKARMRIAGRARSSASSWTMCAAWSAGGQGRSCSCALRGYRLVF